MKKNSLIFLLVFLLCFFILLIRVNYFIDLDRTVYLILISFQSYGITNLVKYYTFFGSATFLIVITVISWLLFKNKYYSKIITINLILSFLTNQVLKFIIARDRPYFIHLVKENGFSFPSGHAMVSFCFYGLIIYLLHKSNLKYKNIIIILLILLIFVIGATRIYLGVHYFSDIIGAYLAGLIYLLVFTNYIKTNKEEG